MNQERNIVAELRDLLRTDATRLGINPESVASPTPHAITAKTNDGSLLRLDVSIYQPAELSL
jgi:hypothetical protein